MDMRQQPGRVHRRQVRMLYLADRGNRLTGGVCRAEPDASVSKCRAAHEVVDAGSVTTLQHGGATG